MPFHAPHRHRLPPARGEPERVYAALVDAEALLAWLPPVGMTGQIRRPAGRRLPDGPGLCGRGLKPRPCEGLSFPAALPRTDAYDHGRIGLRWHRMDPVATKVTPRTTKAALRNGGRPGREGGAEGTRTPDPYTARPS